MLQSLRKAILLLGDIAVLYLSLYLMLMVRYLSLPSAAEWERHLGPFTVAFAGWIVVFYIADLYNLHTAVNNSRFYANASRAILIAGLLSVTFFYLSPAVAISPKRNMLIYVVTVFWLLLLWRRLFNRALESYLPKHPVAFIGWNAQVRELVNTIIAGPHLGLRVSAVYGPVIPAETGGVSFIDDLNTLSERIRTDRVETVVVAENLHVSPLLRQTLFSSLPLRIDFVTLPHFYEQVTGKVPLDAITQMWFLENLSERSKRWFDSAKRGYDLLIATTILIVTLPFWLIIFGLIKSGSRGPIFIRQTRVGRYGKQFTIIKFRSMYEENNDRRITRRNDSRITPFGQMMRKTRIDELPQVLNILAGDMSFIGPRPERPELVASLKNEIPFYEERLLVKPGLTGWDQVSGEYHSPSKEDTIKKLQYDLFYIKNRSLYLDLSIILKTIATVLRTSGI